MPRKRTSNRENKRIDHKRARMAEKQAEQGGTVRTVHGMHWSTKMPQPSLPEEPARHPSRKGGCKRNKGGPHVIVAWPTHDLYQHVYNPETRRFEFRRRWGRYHPSYRCERCGKGFYRVPKNTKAKTTTRVIDRTPCENEVKSDHWDLYNIRMRLLGLGCRCKSCNPR